MTPKEKAKQLYNKMKFETECNSQPSTVHGMCKKLALVCVDEIQEHAQMIETEYEGYNNPYQYFLQVKLEISKRSELLKFMDWHYEDDIADQKTKETIVDTYLE